MRVDHRVKSIRKSDPHRGIHRARLLRDMGLPSKVPAAEEGEYYNIPVYSDCSIKEPWNHVRVVVYTSDSEPGRKSSSHRIMIKCPCGQEIPTGRYHQHAPACGQALVCSGLALFEKIMGLRNHDRTWQEIERRLGVPEPWILVDVISHLSELEKAEIRSGEKAWTDYLR